MVSKENLEFPVIKDYQDYQGQKVFKEFLHKGQKVLKDIQEFLVNKVPEEYLGSRVCQALMVYL